MSFAFLSGAKPILLALATLAVIGTAAGFYVHYSHLVAENRRLVAASAAQTQQLDAATRANAAAAEALALQRRLHEQDMAALQRAHAAALEAADQLHALEEEAADAPAADDGPIAPLARRGLARLRELGAAAAPGGADGDTGGGPGGAPAVPPGAGGATGRGAAEPARLAAPDR